MKKTRRIKTDLVQIKSFIKTAQSKINKAEKILSIDQQLAFQAAYEAMLRASLGFMLSFGERPRIGVGHHKVVVDFVAQKLGEEYRGLVKIFDLMRRKRNEILYEPDIFITEKEASESLRIARKYLRVISSKIEKRYPQQKLF